MIIGILFASYFGFALCHFAKKKDPFDESKLSCTICVDDIDANDDFDADFDDFNDDVDDNDDFDDGF